MQFIFIIWNSYYMDKLQNQNSAPGKPLRGPTGRVPCPAGGLGLGAI